MSKNILYIRLINSQRWRDCRGRQLRQHPLCEMCEQEGRIRLAEEVHHIRPIESMSDAISMERLAYDPGNLMSICRECHHKVHAELMSHSKKAVQANSKRKTDQFFKRYFDE